jgi:splicing factor 3B subunit 3
MFLYDINLQSSQCIDHAVTGYFSGSKIQEILCSRGTNELELLRPDIRTGKLVSVIKVPIFGVIRSILPFRLTGSTKGKALIIIILMKRNKLIHFWR